MAFFTIDTNPIDVQHAGATEEEPDRGGDLERAFAGNLRSSQNYRKRKLRFTLGIMSQATYESLVSTYDDGDAHVCSGDALGGASVSMIIQINGGDYKQDGALGHVRDAELVALEV